jgi:oligopeptide transport system permease protein
VIRYLIKRVIIGGVSLFFLTLITFILVHAIPGNPFDTGNVSEQILSVLEEKYGMDQPLGIQYIKYMEALVKGDLGMSMKKPGVAVNDLIERGMKITGRIGGMAFLVSVILGSLIGIWQLVTKRSGVRMILRGIQSVGIGVPNFVYALLLMTFFGVYLRWFPVAGLTGAANYVLPVISLAILPVSTIARMVYGAARKEETQEYIVFLEAKGFGRMSILCRHMWRPILAQVLVCLGQVLVSLLTGCFVVESIFTIPGLGREFVNAISNRDYTVVMGLTVFMGTTVITTQIVLDVMQMCLDPRMRYGLDE